MGGDPDVRRLARWWPLWQVTVAVLTVVAAGVLVAGVAHALR